MKKILIILGGLALVVVIGLGGLGWWAYRASTAPMYEPGTLAATAALAPPAGAASEASPWRVEPDVDLHHFRRGEGPPVLFVHGGPGVPVREPMPWLDELAETHAVHLYDQRGCGDSSRPVDRFASSNWMANAEALEGALGLGAQVGDIERIRRLLGVERLALVGHSFGGLLATLYAVEFPDRVSSLILLAPADLLVMPSPGDDLFALVRSRLPPDEIPAYDELLAEYLNFGALFERDEATLARLNWRLGNFILLAMDRSPLPASEAATFGGWMVHAMYLSMGRRHDWTPALARVRAPTLVVHAGDDLQAPRASRQYADAIAGAEFHVAVGADHFFDGDLPGLRDRVRAFLAAPNGAAEAKTP